MILNEISWRGILTGSQGIHVPRTTVIEYARDSFHFRREQ